MTVSGESLGRVAPGFGADLVVLRGRPGYRWTICAPKTWWAVVCRGEVVQGLLPGGVS